MKKIHPIALFRLSVLGPLACRDHFQHGELAATLTELAEKTYDIPASRRCYLSKKTIEAWYYDWKRNGINGLTPQCRVDAGRSKLAEAIQEAIISAKRDDPRRSIDQVIVLLERQGKVANGELARSSVHRLLKAHGLSARHVAGPVVERRSFEAEYAGQIWYGDVMHGPRLRLDGRERKTYLVSLMDDASRLVAHSAFHLDESALSIQAVLKQAVLKRGLPSRLVIDNGAAYRAASLQGICARLEIHLIYCRPYQPEGKGKLERWHRVVRSHFLNELDVSVIDSFDQLNARLWVWIEKAYHLRAHSGLGGKTPLERFCADLPRMRQLGPLARCLDALFYHRLARTVRKDNTVSYQGLRYEVPLGFTRQSIQLVVDPHTEQAIAVEDDDGRVLGPVTPLDLKANARRRRNRETQATHTPTVHSSIETLYQHYLSQMKPDED